MVEEIRPRRTTGDNEHEEHPCANPPIHPHGHPPAVHKRMVPVKTGARDCAVSRPLRSRPFKKTFGSGSRRGGASFPKGVYVLFTNYFAVLPSLYKDYPIRASHS